MLPLQRIAIEFRPLAQPYLEFIRGYDDVGVLAIGLMWRRESAGSTSAIKLSHPIQRTLLGDGRWDGKRSFGFALDGVRVAEKAILNIGRNCEMWSDTECRVGSATPQPAD